MNAIKSTREVFESGNVIITAIHQGHNKTVRIDAKTRNRIPDANNFFSKWVSEKYANKLALENYGKKLNEFNTYKY